MKVTQKYLKKIIKEELENILLENRPQAIVQQAYQKNKAQIDAAIQSGDVSGAGNILRKAAMAGQQPGALGMINQVVRQQISQAVSARPGASAAAKPTAPAKPAAAPAKPAATPAPAAPVKAAPVKAAPAKPAAAPAKPASGAVPKWPTPAAKQAFSAANQAAKAAGETTFTHDRGDGKGPRKFRVWGG